MVSLDHKSLNSTCSNTDTFDSYVFWLASVSRHESRWYVWWFIRHHTVFPEKRSWTALKISLMFRMVCTALCFALFYSNVCRLMQLDNFKFKQCLSEIKQDRGFAIYTKIIIDHKIITIYWKIREPYIAWKCVPSSWRYKKCYSCQRNLCTQAYFCKSEKLYSLRKVAD